jgi:predicted DsbA family dithiol-disulfide isomerase
MRRKDRTLGRKMLCAVVLLLAGTRSDASRELPRDVSAQTPTIITLIEYSDLQCPYAAKGQRVIERVLAVYGQVVNYEYRHHPFKRHPHAKAAAERYEAVRIRSSVAADALRRIIFQEQHRLNHEGDAFLDDAISRVGFDPRAIVRESRSFEISRRLKAEMREVEAHAFDLSPSYIIAGVDIRGPASFKDFEDIICRELRTSRGHERSNVDCWALVQPNWLRLEELDREQP